MAIYTSVFKVETIKIGNHYIQLILNHSAITNRYTWYAFGYLKNPNELTPQELGNADIVAEGNSKMESLGNLLWITKEEVE